MDDETTTIASLINALLAAATRAPEGVKAHAVIGLDDEPIPTLYVAGEPIPITVL